MMTMEVSAHIPSASAPFPTSPNGSRKRSFHEFEKTTTTTTTTTNGAGLLTTLSHFDDEDKENTGAINVEILPSAVKMSSSEPLSDKPAAQAAAVHSSTSSTGVCTQPGAIEVRIPHNTGYESNVQMPLGAMSGMGNVLPPSPSPSTPRQQTSESSEAPAMKKRKMSPGTKEAKQREKEEKERLKMDEKLKKEEEKRAKEGEKRKKDAERDEERKRRDERKKQKEEEKAAKEEERRKKEEEKTKKERSQMRLNAFFVKPAASASAAPSTTLTAAESPKKPVEQNRAVSDEVSRDRSVDGPSDYQREFPDFFLQSHTTMAPMHRFQRDLDALSHVREKVDACMQSPASGPLIFRPSETFQIMAYRRRLGRQTASVKQILLKLQESEGSEAGKSAETQREVNLHDALRRLRMKTLKFGEDVRPPYQGTWTRPVPQSAAAKLARNPFHRGLPDTNYDYDSEAEWEEPEEGEDLNSDEEDEGSDDGDDDMDGFLDDAEDGVVDGKRRLIVGDLEPSCSGICWQEDGVPPESQAYKMQTIWDSVTLPIDPFSTSYWNTAKPTEQVTAKHATVPTLSGRSTLHAYAVNTSAQMSAENTAAGTKPLDMPTVATAVSQSAGVPYGAKARRQFPPELLADFKQAVQGSDLTKMGLVEILKKRFPKVSKDVLKETLNQVAVRVGQREADKKWVCRG